MTVDDMRQAMANGTTVYAIKDGWTTDYAEHLKYVEERMAMTPDQEEAWRAAAGWGSAT